MYKKKKKIQSYFKFLFYKLFQIYHGKIKGKILPEDDREIITEKITLNQHNYKIYYCANSSLYTDTIHDTAIIKDDKIIEGPSFQLRDNKNVNPEFNSVFTKGTPRLKKKLNGTVFSLLTGGGGNTNYWHWLLDVLPRIHIANNSKYVGNEIDFYLFPSLDSHFQNETLDFLNIPKNKRLSSKHYRHLFSDKIIVTSHPYNLLNDPEKDSLNIPSWISNYLRGVFLKKVINLKTNKLSPKKIYINRLDGRSQRLISNEKDVAECLKKKGFESLTLSKLSFSEQVNFFHNADYIAGLHGAGFANTIFCKPNTKILEFRSITAGDAIKNLVAQNKLVYEDISSENKTLKYENQYGDIEVNIDLLNSILKLE